VLVCGPAGCERRAGAAVHAVVTSADVVGVSCSAWLFSVFVLRRLEHEGSATADTSAPEGLSTAVAGSGGLPSASFLATSRRRAVPSTMLAIATWSPSSVRAC